MHNKPACIHPVAGAIVGSPTRAYLPTCGHQASPKKPQERQTDFIVNPAEYLPTQCASVHWYKYRVCASACMHINVCAHVCLCICVAMCVRA